MVKTSKFDFCRADICKKTANQKYETKIIRWVSETTLN